MESSLSLYASAVSPISQAVLETSSAVQPPPEAATHVSESFMVGKKEFRKIRYDELQPGDIVCTYESTSTSPSIRTTLAFQKAARFFKEDNYLHKTLHFEIIIEKCKRNGVYKIAHADGLQGKVCTKVDNLKRYMPGQALLIFRPTSTAISEEIVGVAKITSDKGNPWTIRFIDEKTWWKKVILVFQYLKCEYFGSKLSDSEIRERATYLINAADSQGFYEEDGITPKPMSCVEYVSNVINLAMVKKIFPYIVNANLPKNQKIDLLTEALKAAQVNKKLMKLPLFYLDQAVSSASFIDFLMQNEKDYKSVGFVGSADEALKKSFIPIKKLSKKPISQDHLRDLYLTLEGETFGGEVNPRTVKTTNKVFAILKNLNFVNHLGFLICDKGQLDNIVKLRTAFAVLYANLHGLSTTFVSNYMNDARCMDPYNDVQESFAQFQVLIGLLPPQEIELEDKEEEKMLLLFGFKNRDHLALVLRNHGILQKQGIGTDKKTQKRIKHFFIHLLADQRKLDKEILTHCLEGKQDLYEAANARFEPFRQSYFELIENRNRPLTSDEYEASKHYESIRYEDLSHKEHLRLIDVEKAFIKADDRNPFQRTALSLNALERDRIQALKNPLANRIITVGLACLVLPPVGMIILGVGLLVKTLAIQKGKFYANWQKKILHLQETVRPNAKISLISRVEYQTRPWIHYSNDQGRTWETEPLILNPMSLDHWQANMHVKEGCLYKFFIGPEYIDHEDPLAEVKAWQKTNDNEDVVVLNSQMDWDDEGIACLPTCRNPDWQQP